MVIIDMQNYTCTPSSPLFATNKGDFWGALDGVIRAQQRALACCRQRGVEVIYTVIECLTRSVPISLSLSLSLSLSFPRRKETETDTEDAFLFQSDCRDNSRDYAVSGLIVPRGSWGAQVIDALKPGDDEIVLPKTSCDVFVSTNLDYVLRCLGTRHLLVAGGLTDQCVESCVRHAADLGYNVTLLEDACIAHSEEAHAQALASMRGFCRVRTVQQVFG